jgi:hypothetical protein
VREFGAQVIEETDERSLCIESARRRGRHDRGGARFLDGQGDDTRIIGVSHDQANDPLWSVVKNGVAAAGKETGVTVEYRAPKNLRYGCDVATDRRGREPEDLHYLNVMAGPKRVWRFKNEAGSPIARLMAQN